MYEAIKKHVLERPLVALGALGAAAAGAYFYFKGKKPATSVIPAIVKPASAIIAGLKVPPANMPSTTSPSGQRVPSTVVPTTDPVAAASEVLADAIRTQGCKAPAVMASVMAWQNLVGGLTADGKYGPMTAAALATHITTQAPAACSWSS